MYVRGLEQLSLSELDQEIQKGGRFVFFEYCVSLLVVSSRRPSPVWFLKSDELAWGKRLRFSLLSFLLGWWGIPWGLVYTPLTLITNLTGGCDVTAQFRPETEEELAGLRARE